MNYEWQGAGTKLPSGHTIFETHKVRVGIADFLRGSSGSWAIADQSGFRPDLTDDVRLYDEVMFLDFNRPLDVSTSHSPVVPLTTKSGKRYSTPVDAPTIFFLAREFGWPVVDEVRGRYFNVR